MEFIEYLLKVNIAIALFYMLYRLLFQSDTFFHWKRFLLLSVIGISCLYPFVSFPGFWERNNGLSRLLSGENYDFKLPEVIISNAEGMSVFDIITRSYGFISFILLMFMVYRIFMIMSNVRKGEEMEIREIEIITLSGIKTPFSFFNYIVLDPSRHKEDELDEIILHEKAHRDQWHSVDAVLCELICCFCWFNPFAWLLKKEIRMNLEFLADHSVIASGCDSQHYQFHLLRLSYSKAIAQLTNNINVSSLKNRIHMMNKTKSSWKNMAKYGLFLPLAAGLLFLNNLQAQNSPQSEKSPNQEEQRVDVSVSVVEPQKEEIFEQCEVMPEYPGGINELMNFLGNNVKYPEEAQDKGIQGIVVVRFVVDKEGKVSDPVVVRSLDPTTDKEALRVIGLMPKWVPGKQKGKPVSVYFTLPISYKLTK